MTLGQIFDPGTNICPWYKYLTLVHIYDHPWAKVPIAQVQKKKGPGIPFIFPFS